MSKNDGGPAYPVSFGPDGTPGYADGMSLRDYFAGQALAGMVSNLDGPRVKRDPEGLLRSLPPTCYALADAMLAERDREGQG